jgi:hypothetical protein
LAAVPLRALMVVAEIGLKRKEKEGERERERGREGERETERERERQRERERGVEVGERTSKRVGAVARVDDPPLAQVRRGVGAVK